MNRWDWAIPIGAHVLAIIQNHILDADFAGLAGPKEFTAPSRPAGSATFPTPGTDHTPLMSA
jgi:hypothetical protein